ncbi:DNA excision repair protein ERCC-5-like [Mya arenaria]|uniref:DNA excision repair protein ERCC-5-like n=1 Tax=Mya arenaria TaxID=6604 RepID=UPI0022E8B411|nr:DNA excision repair protein ERCC-5-like [Mya arenaria]
MGVHGLWQLLGSTGKPVPLESLEGKILAIDVSVWLHQLSKGMRDGAGNPLPHAHLHGLFTRICKLLYYRIKPVFVFDGGVPMLKKQTLAARRGKREEAEQASIQMQQKILTNLIRSQALQEACGGGDIPILPPQVKNARAKKDAMFELPPLPESSKVFLSQKSADDDTFADRQELREMVEDEYQDLQSIDVDSPDFKALPLELQHEIIKDIRLSRKNYNLSKIVELPEDSKDFSSYQLSKLVKHNRLNTRLDDIQRDLNQRQTRTLAHQYGATFHDDHDVYSAKLASDDSAHYFLAKRNLLRKKEVKEEGSVGIKASKDEGQSSKVAKGFVDKLVESDDESEDEITELADGWEKSKPSLSLRAKSTQGLKSDTEQGVRRRTDSNNSKSKAGLSDDRPRFKPVIEIESGSDSDSEMTDLQGNEFMKYDASVDDDRDLQQAIEQSLRDKNTQGDIAVIDELSDERIESRAKTNATKCGNSLNDISKHKEKAVIILRSEKGGDDIETQDKPVPKGRSFNISKQDLKANNTSESKGNSINLDKSPKSGIQMSRSYATRSSILKRKIANTSDRSDGSDKAGKRVKIVVSSSDEEVVDMDTAGAGKPGTRIRVSESESDSEDDFIEVKVDLRHAAEDELFPASLFQFQEETAENKLPDGLSKVAYDEKDTTEAKSMNKNLAKKPDNDEKPLQKLQNTASEVKNIENTNMDTTTIPNIDIPKAVESEPTIVNSSSDNSDEEMLDSRGELKADEEKSVRERSEFGSLVEEVEEQVARERSESESSVEDVEEQVPETMETQTGDIFGENSNQSSVSGASLQDSVTSQDVPDLVRQYECLRENKVRALREDLVKEATQLRQDQGRQERLAASITDQMNSEAQELLQLFGIPYIVSPGEAEAQCAFLEVAGLTHGTITDDSDIWLFGGKCVFKNFFNQKKFVECFKDVNITSQLGLVRHSLINLALLCGSDYTEGIKGVGPVLGLEILGEFPGCGFEGLAKFRSWWERAQQSLTIPKYESKLKAKLRQLDLRSDFPSPVVVEAYLKPTVDESTERFSWSLPNPDQLREYTASKLGWDRSKTDENLLPVLKRLAEKQGQRSISSFFQPEVYIQPAKTKSKRVLSVVEKIKNPAPVKDSIVDDDANGADKTDKSSAKEKKPSTRGTRNKKTENKIDAEMDLIVDEDDVNDVDKADKSSAKEKKPPARRTRKKKIENNVDAEKDNGNIVNDDPMTKVISIKHGSLRQNTKTKGSVSHIIDTDKQPTNNQRETRSSRSGEKQKGQLEGAGKLELNARQQKGFDKAQDEVKNVKTPSFSETSDSDSDSDSEFDSDFSDPELGVVNSGVSVDEILKLKMGDDTGDVVMKDHGSSNLQIRVFEKRCQVAELLGLEKGSFKESDIEILDKEESAVEENGKDIRSDMHTAEDMPEEIRSAMHTTEEMPEEGNTKVDYSMEGGFVKEEADYKIHDTVHQGEQSEVFCTQEKQCDTKIIDHDAVVEYKNGTKSLDNNTALCVPEKSTSDIKNDIKKEPDDVKTVESNTSTNSEPQRRQSQRKRSSRKEVSIYTENPLQPIVKGVPWKDTGRSKRRGPTGKGSSKNKCTKLPKEIVTKNDRKARVKGPNFGCVNLSESDSD